MAEIVPKGLFLVDLEVDVVRARIWTWLSIC